MPVPREGFNWNDGILTKSLCVFLPAVGDMLCGIVSISCNNVIQVSIITDKHYIDEPDEFI